MPEAQMFDEWRFERRLSKLQRDRARIEKLYTEKMHQAFKARSSVEEKENLINSKQMDLEECDDEINSLTTGYLISESRKLFIEIPPRDSELFWFVSTTFGSRYLTPSGVTKVRNDIRAERKARWEMTQPKLALLVTLVTSMTGVLGAVIGVLSFLKGGPPK
jgi:hypothetical protein